MVFGAWKSVLGCPFAVRPSLSQRTSTTLRLIFTDSYLGMENFLKCRENFILKSDPLHSVKLISKYKRYGATSVHLNVFNRIFDSMENSESLYKAGDILRDICSEEFQLGEDGSVTQTGHRDVGKLHHSLNLFFYYCLHFNNLKAASKMWNHPVIANTELKSGPKVPTAIRNNNRHNRLIYYIMLYRSRKYSEILEDAQPLLLSRDPLVTSAEENDAMDYDSATLVAAALAKHCVDPDLSEEEASRCLEDVKKLYDANMRYFQSLRGIRYMTNKKVPKYRLNTIYAWMAHVLGEQDLAYELMTSKFFHYNQESRNLKLAVLAERDNVKELLDFFEYCLDDPDGSQRTYLGPRGQTLSFEAVHQVKQAVKKNSDSAASQQRFEDILSKFGRGLTIDTSNTIEEIVFRPIDKAKDEPKAELKDSTVSSTAGSKYRSFENGSGPGLGQKQTDRSQMPKIAPIKREKVSHNRSSWKERWKQRSESNHVNSKG